MTIYIKIMDDTGEIVAVEELIDPVYVYKQPSNGEIVRCIETLARASWTPKAPTSTSCTARNPSIGLWRPPW